MPIDLFIILFIVNLAKGKFFFVCFVNKSGKFIDIIL